MARHGAIGCLRQVAARVVLTAVQPGTNIAEHIEKEVAKAGLPALRTRLAMSKKDLEFVLSLRKSLRKQLARLADEADMTMRAFVLEALKVKGLDVRPDDLLDLRKERR